MNFVENSKADGCQHPEKSAECPEQVRIRAIQNKPCKIGTDCKGDAPGETGDCHIAAAHGFRGEAGNKRLLETVKRSFHLSPNTANGQNFQKGTCCNQRKESRNVCEVPCRLRSSNLRD